MKSHLSPISNTPQKVSLLVISGSRLLSRASLSTHDLCLFSDISLHICSVSKSPCIDVRMQWLFVTVLKLIS